MDLKAIRRLNLLALSQTHPSKSAFAAACGIEPDFLGQLLSGRRNIGDALALKLENQLNLINGSLSRPTIEQIAQLAPAENQELIPVIFNKALDREAVAILKKLIERL